ncbi:DEAD/DEAH box helicase [Candidatus Bathyarchaeota archaeon]|nr:DEAD/DEAH box helicase [Candidatus Bathyarchaeota archaeon]
MAHLSLFDHPLINVESIERRTYQERVAENALRGNTLVSIPTGLGKSLIAALVAAKRLEQYPDRHVVILAPTRPLVEQHFKTFKRLLRLDPQNFACVTGQVSPDDRVQDWTKRLVVSTPQVFVNDLIAGKIHLDEISLLVFDEAHRAVGDYAYTYIGERYSKVSRGLVLGLTASPGSSKEAIQEVCKNLNITRIESRTISDTDVKPFVGGIKVDWVPVELPPIFRDVKRILDDYVKDMLKGVRDYGYLPTADADRVRLRDILQARERIRSDMIHEPAAKDLLRRISFGLYSSIHALKSTELLETQGFSPLKAYLDGLQERLKKRAMPWLRAFLEDPRIMNVLRITSREVEKGNEHPKMQVLIARVRETFVLGSRRVIIFTNYRVTAARIVEELSKQPGVSAVRLVGQQTKSRDKGLSQKQQTMLLEDFKSGQYNVLVATQIGEEGLDIVECDEVIFYDTVPSAIRYIQRRGRTGRKGPGKATVLMALGTRDEAYYYISRRRERMMAVALKQVASQTVDADTGPDQPKMEEFMKEQEMTEIPRKPTIIVDSRELGSATTRELSKYDIAITPETLSIGDFIISDRTAVERKTVEDFVASIIDGRLFEQVSNLKSAYEMPILLIEGEGFQTSRNIAPEAVMGAVASVIVDFGVPVVWTRSPSESALLLLSIARREQSKGERRPRIRMERKPESLAHEQEFVIAGLPLIDTVLARRLLRAFGTIEKVFLASEQELQNVEGIGRKISDRIRKLLTAPYREDDTITSP